MAGRTGQSPPGWLEKSDQAGVILYVIDGLYCLPLKVHKRENFFGSDFVRFWENRFFIAPLLREIQFSAYTETKGNRLKVDSA